MKRAAPLLVSLVLIGTLGVVHGVYTDRWGPSGQLEHALAGLPRVPAKFGDWTGDDMPLDPEAMNAAGIRGGMFRKYSNPRTGESVSFLIVCGRGGPITVHTPDVCYAGAGYRQLDAEQTKSIDSGGGAKSTFKVAHFAKASSVLPMRLEIYWAWSRDGETWQAPENPRLALARAPALYKLYVVREYAHKSRIEYSDASEAFLKQALPVIRQTLPVSGS
jgi:uncharacterized protein DUF3485